MDHLRIEDPSPKYCYLPLPISISKTVAGGRSTCYLPNYHTTFGGTAEAVASKPNQKKNTLQTNTHASTLQKFNLQLATFT